MAVSVEFSFDVEQHLRAWRNVLRRSKLRLLVPIAVSTFIGIGVVYFLLALGRDASFVSAALQASAWIVVAAIYGTVMPWWNRRWQRRTISRDASIIGPQRRQVDEAGFHSEGNSVKVSVPWHAMVRAIESEEFFLFYYNKYCAYYLAKSLLTESEMDEVRQLLARAPAA